MDSPKPRRRFRFSLRTLLLLVTVASVPFSWLGCHMQQVRFQREFLSSGIAERVYFDYQGYQYVYFYNDYGSGVDDQFDFQAEPRGPKWLHDFAGDDFFASIVFVNANYAKSPVAAQVLARVCKLPHLRGLTLQQSSISVDSLAPLTGLAELERLNVAYTATGDAGLSHLQHLANLRVLQIQETSVSDAGLVTVGNLSRLEFLNVGHNQVGDAGIKNLSQLQHLQVLLASNTNITDAGVAHLRALPNLLLLDLFNCPGITDASLSHIEGMTQLEELIVYGTKSTEVGCKELQKVLPKLRIVR